MTCIMSAYRDRKLKRVEILAPGGSMEGIRTAVNAGADAVYAGGKAFGARAYAQNPEQEDLFEAIDYCHLHGARLYLTVNTLLKERELQNQLYEYLAPVCGHGVDAVLVQDFGVFHFIRREFPDLPIHASTQMTVTGADGVRLLRDMGASRVVLSRELSLEEITKIHDEVDIELETFVHGALCYCYSGQCLMSSLIGGRSGNRGRCAQPCRLPYELTAPSSGSAAPDKGRVNGKAYSRKDEPYLLSPKDICTLKLLPDLIDAGVVSLKIEGRMKSPEYAAGVTSMYRRYTDLYLERGRKGYHVDPEDEKLLTQLFSRGPYSEGYYLSRNGRDMMVLRDQKKEKGEAFRRSQEAVKEIHDRYSEERKIPLTGTAYIHADSPMMLSVSCDHRAAQESDCKAAAADPGFSTYEADLTAQACGACPIPAVSRPADEDSVRRQLMKTGDTPFVFTSLQIDLEDGLFVPVKELNALRRDALDSLRELVLSSFRRDMSARGMETDSAGSSQAGSTAGHSGSPERKTSHPSVTASVCSLEQLEAVLMDERVGGIYLDLPICTQETVRRAHESGKKAYVMMPPVWRSDTVRFFEKKLDRVLAQETDGFLLRSFDQIGYLTGRFGKDKEYIADAGLYTWNSEARRQLRLLGITTDTLPYECTARELADRGCSGSECVIYGHQVLMISAQCLTKTTTGCRHTGAVRWLKDRKGILFPVRNDCSICTNLIYNSVPLDLLSLKDEVDRLNPSSVRCSFTVESGEQTERILRGEVPDAVTRGHFRKGVE